MNFCFNRNILDALYIFSNFGQIFIQILPTNYST
jgi:hypothetical protein